MRPDWNRVARYGKAVLLATAIARFGLAMFSGQTYTKGDYYHTLPGAYVEALNPTLWNSPDLEDIQGKQSTYLRGPSQYLTLYPLALLDSYEEIARTLLVAYALAVFAIVFISSRVATHLAGRRVTWIALAGSTLLFFPLIQAYVAREFEIVIALGFAVAYWATVTDRMGTLGSALAYVTLFKYMPVIALPYLAARRWWRSIVAFAAVAAGLLILAHSAFGLERFVNNHLPGMAAGQLTGLVSNAAFCDGPNRLLQVSDDSQERNVRYAMCTLSGVIAIPAPVLFVALAAAALGVSMWAFFRLERTDVSPPVERWRRVWELSIVVVVATTFFYSHYYYLCLLILPMNMLLIRRLADDAPRPVMIAAWLTTYALLSAWLIPPSFAGRLLNIDVWRLYTTSLSYFFGELLLLGLVLREYATLPVGSVVTPSSNA